MAVHHNGSEFGPVQPNQPEGKKVTNLAQARRRFRLFGGHQSSEHHQSSFSGNGALSTPPTLSAEAQANLEKARITYQLARDAERDAQAALKIRSIQAYSPSTSPLKDDDPNAGGEETLAKVAQRKVLPFAPPAGPGGPGKGGGEKPNPRKKHAIMRAVLTVTTGIGIALGIFGGVRAAEGAYVAPKGNGAPTTGQGTPGTEKTPGVTVTPTPENYAALSHEITTYYKTHPEVLRQPVQVNPLSGKTAIHLGKLDTATYLHDATIDQLYDSPISNAVLIPPSDGDPNGVWKVQVTFVDENGNTIPTPPIDVNALNIEAGQLGGNYGGAFFADPRAEGGIEVPPIAGLNLPTPTTNKDKAEYDVALLMAYANASYQVNSHLAVGQSPLGATIDIGIGEYDGAKFDIATITMPVELINKVQSTYNNADNTTAFITQPAVTKEEVDTQLAALIGIQRAEAVRNGGIVEAIRELPALVQATKKASQIKELQASMAALAEFQRRGRNN